MPVFVHSVDRLLGLFYIHAETRVAFFRLRERAGDYLEIVSPDKSRIFSPPVRLVPESPEQDALHGRMAIERSQRRLVEIRSSVLVLSQHI